MNIDLNDPQTIATIAAVISLLVGVGIGYGYAAFRFADHITETKV